MKLTKRQSESLVLAMLAAARAMARGQVPDDHLVDSLAAVLKERFNRGDDDEDDGSAGQTH